MRFGSIVLISFIAMQLLVYTIPADSARFVQREITALPGDNVIIGIVEDSPEGGSVNMHISISDPDGGEAVFDETDSSYIEDETRLPGEKKMYDAIFRAGMRGDYKIHLDVNGHRADSLSIRISDHPNLPEAGLPEIGIIMALAGLIFARIK
ncbi:MAG: hypothetical protein GXO64_02690 [Candidatus Micrarchaeota archaeon]|nr:hypothetical protein [Candidatus Micrarchaeota archaeon]